MKCKYCSREVIGKVCSYCGEEVVSEEVIVEPINKEAKEKIFIIITLCLCLFGLTILSYFFDYFIIPCLLGAICLFILIKRYKTNKAIKKILFYCTLFIVLCILLCLQPSINHIQKEYRIYTFSKKYSEILNIELLDTKPTNYEYNIGYKTNVRYEYYSYQINTEEYNKLSSLTEMKSYEITSSFIERVTTKKDNGYYLIYDLNKKAFDEPTSKLNYNYVLIEIYEDNGKMYFTLYNVMKRKY